MLNGSGALTATGAEGNGSLMDGFGVLAAARDGALQQVLSVVLTVMLAMVVFSLGCSVEPARLWSHLRRPQGVLVGLLCQFGLMPLTAYLLVTGFSVQPVQAVAIIIMGCCPGGVISNIITYWMEGDMDLSITMTSVSTVLGMGMMPVCLYVFTHTWVEAGRIRIPYFNIGITLITLVVPVAFGVAVNHKWPKAAKMILKVQDHRHGDGGPERPDLLHRSTALLPAGAARAHVHVPAHLRLLSAAQRPPAGHSLPNL